LRREGVERERERKQAASESVQARESGRGSKKGRE